MRPTTTIYGAAAALALAAPALFGPQPAHAQGGYGQGVPSPRPEVSGRQEALLKNVRLEQKLNGAVPLEIPFRDESGRAVRLADYFGEKPVMLVMIQYRCTMLCTEEMNILMQSLKEMKFTPGREFELLIVSIDPREGPELASVKRQSHLEIYGRPDAQWRFLTGEESSIRKLADAVGFHYVYDARSDQYAHPDGVIILTPKGRVARYFFKLDYPPRDLRLGLVEAADNRIGTALDAIALLCFHYNPETGTYGVGILKVIRLAGILTVLLMALCITTMKLHERRKRKEERGNEQSLLPAS